MKTIYTIIILLSISLNLFAQDTFINPYPYQDLWPEEWYYPDTENCNVIPAIGGGYLMCAFLNPGNGQFGEPQSMFWKISEDGELEWRKQDYSKFAYAYFTSMESNGIDRYYAITEDGFWSNYTKLFIMDEYCNVLSRHNYDLDDGLDIKVLSIIKIDDGLMCAGTEGGYGFVMRTGLDGELIWERKDTDWGCSTVWNREFNTVIQTSDGNFATCGFQAYGSGHGFLYKFTPQGDTLWTRMYEDMRFLSVMEYSPDSILVFATLGTPQKFLTFNADGDMIEEVTFSLDIIVSQYQTGKILRQDDNILLLYNTME